MIINNLLININKENINRDFDVAELTASFFDKDILVSYLEKDIITKALSYNFSFGRKLYVLYKKDDPLIEKLKEDAYKSRLVLKLNEFDNKTIAQLFYNYLPNIIEHELYLLKNLNGKLYLFIKKDFKHKDIPCFEITIDKFENTLTPFYIKPMVLKKYNSKNDSNYSTFYKVENFDVFQYNDNNASDKYIIKNARNQNSPALEKIYLKMVELLNKTFDKYIKIDLANVNTTGMDKTAIFDFEYYRTLKFNFINYLDDESILNRLNICMNLMDEHQIKYSVSMEIDPDSLNIILMHNKEYYESGIEEEPHIINNQDAIVKIVTLESLSGKDVHFVDFLICIFHELILEKYFRIKKLYLSNEINFNATFIHFEKDNKNNILNKYTLFINDDSSLKYNVDVLKTKTKEDADYVFNIGGKKYNIFRTGLYPIKLKISDRVQSFNMDDSHYVLSSGKYSMPLIIRVESDDDFETFDNLFSNLSIKLYKYEKNIIQFIPFKIIYEILNLKN